MPDAPLCAVIIVRTSLDRKQLLPRIGVRYLERRLSKVIYLNDGIRDFWTHAVLLM